LNTVGPEELKIEVIEELNTVGPEELNTVGVDELKKVGIEEFNTDGKSVGEEDFTGVGTDVDGDGNFVGEKVLAVSDVTIEETGAAVQEPESTLFAIEDVKISVVATVSIPSVNKE